MSDPWFEYRLCVQPHHTDYGGVVWHGNYIAWMEEARIACLRARGISFSQWVEAGVDLPVVDLALQYRQPMTLGMEACVRTRCDRKGVRLLWQYDVQDGATQTSCVTGTITLVPVDRHARRVIRRLPPQIAQDMERLLSSHLGQATRATIG